MSLDNWAQEAVERLDRLEAERALLDFVDPNDQQSSSAKRLQEINSEIEELYEKLNAYADGLGDEDTGAGAESDSAAESESGRESASSGPKAPLMPKVVPASPPPFDRTAVLPKGGLPVGANLEAESKTVGQGDLGLKPPPLPSRIQDELVAKRNAPGSNKTALLWPVESASSESDGDPDANVDTAVVPTPSPENQNPSAEARRARIKARARKLTVQVPVESSELEASSRQLLAERPGSESFAEPAPAPTLGSMGNESTGSDATRAVKRRATEEQTAPRLVDLKAEIQAEMSAELVSEESEPALRLPLPDLSSDAEAPQEADAAAEAQVATTQTGMPLSEVVESATPSLEHSGASSDEGGDDEQTAVSSIPALTAEVQDDRLKLAAELSKLREDLEQKSRSRELAASQAEERAKALESLIKQADQVQQELERFRNEKQSLEAEVAELHATFDSEGEQINRTTEALRAMEQRVAREAELLHEIDSVQTRIVGAKSAVNHAKRSAETECKELRDKIEAAQDAAERATVEAERKREAAERAEVRAHKAIEAVEQEQSALQTREKDIDAEVLALESSVQHLKEERATLEAKLEALRSGQPEPEIAAPVADQPAQAEAGAPVAVAEEAQPQGRNGRRRQGRGGRNDDAGRGGRGRRASGRRQPRFELFARDR